MKTYFLFKSIAKNSYGISSDIRRLLYNSVIIPKISYAIPITLPNINKTNMNHIHKIHKSFTNMIIRSFKSTPLSISSYLAKIPNIMYSLTKLHNNLIMKYPVLGSHITLPSYWPNYDLAHPRLKQLYPTLNDLHLYFPSNPKYVLTQAVSKYCKLGIYLNHINNTSKFCPFCLNRSDTIAHLIFYCSHFSKLRYPLIRLTHTWPSNHIFKFPSHLTTFLNSSKRLS